MSTSWEAEMPTYPKMSWEEVQHHIAQAVTNAYRGSVTIRPGSRLHQAMRDLAYYARWIDDRVSTEDL